ncbi:hypothetical protein GCM10009789_83760 [Kribbella sancticallisti]|uniref:DUF304 domain-containing protein n=1 Tax=Kribbella sancticallisti TaxID=460087 RepID=A0ABN2ETN7_9ACTN
MTNTLTLAERQRPPLRRRPPEQRFNDVDQLVQQVKASHSPMVWIRWRTVLGPYLEQFVLIDLATTIGAAGDHLVVRRTGQDRAHCIPLTLLESITREEP